MTRYAVVVACALAGCAIVGGIEDGYVPLPKGGGNGGTPSTGGMGGFGGIGGTPSTGGMGGFGGAQPTLADRGLIARYFFNEAQVGMAPQSVIDHADEPVSLAITYDANLAYSGASTGVGLSWTSPTSIGVAMAPITGTKLRTGLISTEATIVVVIDAVGPVSDDAPILQIQGDPTLEGGRLGVIIRGDALAFELNDTDAADDHSAIWDVDVVDVGRRVLHVVLDTQWAEEPRRTRLFVQGEEQALLPSGPVPIEVPAQFATVDPCDTCDLVVGNTSDGMRPYMGTIYYAAIHNVALDIDEIQREVAVLTDSDDPGVP